MLRAALVVITMVVSTAALAQADVARGAYLVNAVMACDACHTPAGPNGMERRFSGGPQTWATPAYVVKGSNITQDVETGIGSWSEADIARALTEGVRPNGVPLAPQMPFAFYRGLTKDDLNAVAAYVRTIRAVKNTVQPPEYKAAWEVDPVPGATQPLPSVPTDPVQRGLYLANAAHCMECHAKGADGRLDLLGNNGKGGQVMKGGYGTAIVANITSHPTKGLGAWSDDDIKNVLVKGVRPDGRPVAPPMARQMFFSKMTPEDLNAMVAWVRSIPPAE